jgi:hypothetical protein
VKRVRTPIVAVVLVLHPGLLEANEESERALQFRGRMFLRDTFDDASWSNEMLISSIHAGVVLRDRLHGLSAEVETELADGDVEVKDAWLRYEVTKSIDIQVGNFKRPIGAVARSSRWSLPVPERGVVSDLALANELTGEPDKLPVGGRALGVAIRLAPRRAPLDAELTIGAFRSGIHDEIADASSAAERRPIGIYERFADDANARVSIEPARGVEIALSVTWLAMLATAGDRATLRHGLVGAVDTTIKRGPARLWAEAFLGASPMHFGAALRARGRFAAVRIVAALPVGISVGRLERIEPFVAVQGADLSSAIDEDRTWGAGCGLAFHFAGDWRATAAVEHTAFQAQVGVDITRFFLQVGARFVP